MEALSRFRALSGDDRLLVAEAAGLLCLVRLGASILPFRTLQRLLRWYGAASGKATDRLSSEQIGRIAWAVTAVARRLPARTTCLVEALAADAMLRRRGCVCVLRFGVRQPESDRGALAAHAWIEHEGSVVLGQLDNLRDYAVLSVSRSS